MKSWKSLALVILVFGIHSFTSDYYNQRFLPDVVGVLYADIIRDFAVLALALSGHVAALVAYAFYMFFLSFLPTLSYVPDYPHLSLFLTPEVMPVITGMTWVAYTAFFVLLGKQILHLIRNRSWGVAIDKMGDSWVTFGIKKAWVVLFPLAYVIEMHSYSGLFVDNLLSTVGIWPVLLIGMFMLCVFASIRIFFLFSAVAILGTAINLVALIVVYDVPITDWAHLIFRLGLPILTAVSLFLEWRRMTRPQMSLGDLPDNT